LFRRKAFAFHVSQIFLLRGNAAVVIDGHQMRDNN
jgi:hypothetical protein